ncbi:hypothetical protein [Nostoc sp.]|uniref:hypothetical protein n=1 Tax=Nostoc sp. TaxID=1180 RepID=UPI002FF4C807
MNLGVGWGATAPKRFPDLSLARLPQELQVAFESENPTPKTLFLLGFTSLWDAIRERSTQPTIIFILPE